MSPRNSDWHCPKCHDLQFARNSTCRKCGTPKPDPRAAPPWPGGDTRPAPVGLRGRPGDWECPKCGDHVFAAHSACRRCGAPKPQGGGGRAGGASAGAVPGPAAPAAGKAGDWACPGCGDVVFASRAACRKCGTPKPVGAGPDVGAGVGVGAGGVDAPSAGAAPGVVVSAGGPAPCSPSTGPASSAPTPAGGRPGDWTCPGCGDLVFGSRAACRKCNTPKPPSAPGAPMAPGAAGPGACGDWTCPNCAEQVFARGSACRRCGAGRPPSGAPRSPAGDVVRAGDWRCPKCNDVQFARNERCRSCRGPRPQWLGSSLGLAPPAYWSPQAMDGPAWQVVVADPAEVAALRIGMAPGGSFGGRDQRTPLDYKGFRLFAAWRLQHLGLWGKYSMERENMRIIDAKALGGVGGPRVPLRQAYVDMANRLPATLDEGVNEVYLSHGSKPETIVAILGGGLNERFSGGLFGNGTYLAEDVAKNDQYCTPDVRHGAHPDLHQLLFDNPGLTHPGGLYYVFFCRALLGCSIRTQDGNTDLDCPGRSVWSSPKRELGAVAGSSPPVLHHSLVAETGGKIARFREFVMYHGDRIYPEYLVAYQRTK